MKIYLILMTLCFSTTALAEKEFLEFGDKNFSKEKTEKSKWSFKVGSEYIAYQTNLPEYSGLHRSIKKGDKEDIVGYGISFGRDFYIGSGFSASVNLAATYAKSLKRDVGKATPDIDLEIASTRKSHQITTGEVQVALNYLIDYKIVDLQPFIEASLGAGQAVLDYEYQREPIGGANEAEDYDVSSDESFLLTKFSLGMNFISYNGLTSYIKATSGLVAIQSRKIKGSSNVAGTATIIDLDSNEKNLSENVWMAMASIGLGYTF